ncbi:hypothetical protein LIER_40289 [Lithospermum erythrorhizon]|uniref:Uncharacterized protein n=1 Tax=Lithospermum erythrorhizon TaxID=34254 RepID=A0AAV3QVA2_LITER
MEISIIMAQGCRRFEMIWNLPLGYLDAAIGRAIGAHIGEVLEFDKRSIEQERGRYIRVKGRKHGTTNLEEDSVVRSNAQSSTGKDLPIPETNARLALKELKMNSMPQSPRSQQTNNITSNGDRLGADGIENLWPMCFDKELGPKNNALKGKELEIVFSSNTSRDTTNEQKTTHPNTLEKHPDLMKGQKGNESYHFTFATGELHDIQVKQGGVRGITKRNSVGKGVKVDRKGLDRGRLGTGSVSGKRRKNEEESEADYREGTRRGLKSSRNELERKEEWDFQEGIHATLGTDSRHLDMMDGKNNLANLEEHKQWMASNSGSSLRVEVSDPKRP